jgi:hypothetical protein
VAIRCAISFDDGEAVGTLGGSGVGGVDTAKFRTGTRSFKMFTDGAQQGGMWTCNIPDPNSAGAMADGWVYFDMYMDALPSAAYNLLTLFESGTTHVTLQLRSDGKMQATRNGTVLGSVGTNIYVINTHRSIAVRFVIHDSTGEMQVRWDGTTTNDINVTGADTKNGGSGVINQLRFSSAHGAGAVGGSLWVDDVVVQDSTGSAPENTWLTDPECLYVTADGLGTATGWTANTGSKNGAIDDIPRSDADYVQSNTPTDKVGFTMTNIATTALVVYAVCPTAVASKASAGLREIKMLTLLSGSENTGQTITLTATFTWYQSVFHRDPAAAVWTPTNVNNSEGELLVQT